MDIQFKNTWQMYYHYDTQNWTSASFKRLATISTVGEYWAAVDALAKNSQLQAEHLFFMREGIEPIWEHKANHNGGCWSIKVDLRDSLTVLAKILALVMGETSMISPDGTNLSHCITGVSFCSKNSFNAIIQLWNSDRSLNKTSLLNSEITEPFMAEIIYRGHIPEY